MGLSTQAHGGLCQWLINALNVVTGNFDAAGGAMFATPAVSVVGRRSTREHAGRWFTRVRNLPEFDGQLPVSALAEEILEPDEGRVRGLFTVCGNPVLSTPNGTQVDRAFEELELMVSIDIYLNETTRHADFILPPTSGLEVDHYDLAFHALAVRNTTRFSPATIASGDNTLADWQILSELAGRIRRRDGTLHGLGQRVIERAMRWLGPAGIVDLGLKLGPYGAWSSPFRWRSGLTLKRVKQQAHGIDLGPLQPQLPGCLRTPGRRIDLAPPEFVERFQKAKASLAATQSSDGTFALIGRRHLRSCNSWMHNSRRLTKGKELCTLLIHPEDANRLELAEGEVASVASAVGQIELPVERSESIMQGVVSIPHGYGHSRSGTRLSVAEANAGASINDLTDDRSIDELTGNAAFSGQRVTVSKRLPAGDAL